MSAASPMASSTVPGRSAIWQRTTTVPSPRLATSAGSVGRRDSTTSVRRLNTLLGRSRKPNTWNQLSSSGW